MWHARCGRRECAHDGRGRVGAPVAIDGGVQRRLPSGRGHGLRSMCAGFGRFTSIIVSLPRALQRRERVGDDDGLRRGLRAGRVLRGHVRARRRRHLHEGRGRRRGSSRQGRGGHRRGRPAQPGRDRRQRRRQRRRRRGHGRGPLRIVCWEHHRRGDAGQAGQRDRLTFLVERVRRRRGDDWDHGRQHEREGRGLELELGCLDVGPREGHHVSWCALPGPRGGVLPLIGGHVGGLHLRLDRSGLRHGHREDHGVLHEF
mmetsp:Transcript_23455/g.65790  ORF Transcript_23455/g.65790 Transcript_23455/m.65790 type:complete len:258 (-) Transcript_23455:1196-1969(-)